MSFLKTEYGTMYASPKVSDTYLHGTTYSNARCSPIRGNTFLALSCKVTTFPSSSQAQTHGFPSLEYARHLVQPRPNPAISMCKDWGLADEKLELGMNEHGLNGSSERVLHMETLVGLDSFCVF